MKRTGSSQTYTSFEVFTLAFFQNIWISKMGFVTIIIIWIWMFLKILFSSQLVIFHWKNIYIFLFLFLHILKSETNENLETKKYLIFKTILKQNHIQVSSTFSPALKLSSTAQRFYQGMLKSLSADMLLILSYQHCFFGVTERKLHGISLFKFNPCYKFCVLSSLTKILF